jgi:hypothetical protein
VDDITAIVKLETQHEDAIMMVPWDKIAYLDDMSLEGDIPDSVLDIGEAY